MKRTLLKNAKIYDGSGAPAFWGDVLLEDDRIAQVAPSIPAENGWETVDLQGLSLAPALLTPIPITIGLLCARNRENTLIPLSNRVSPPLFPATAALPQRALPTIRPIRKKSAAVCFSSRIVRSRKDG